MDEAQLTTLMVGHIGEITGVTFLAACQSAGAASGKLDVEIGCEWVLVDREGNPLPDMAVEVETGPGQD
jgi:hypothetical protein